MRTVRVIVANLTGLVFVAAGTIGCKAAEAANASMTVYTVTVGDSSSSVVNGVLFDGKYIWAAIQNPDGGVVQKLSASGAIISTTGVGSAPLEMAFDRKSNIWVTNYTSSSISVVGEGGNLVTTISVPGTNPEGIVFDGEYMWVANNGNNSNTVSQFDAANMSRVGTYSVGHSPDGVAFDGNNIWVTNSYSNNVWVLNRRGHQIAAYGTGVFPLSLISDGHNMWIGNGTGVNVGTQVSGTGSLTKINIATGQNMGTFSIGHHVRGLAYDGVSIWACNGNDNTVSRVRASNVALLGTFATGLAPRAAAFDGTKIWVANSGANTLTVFVPQDLALSNTEEQSASAITGASPSQIRYRAVAPPPPTGAMASILIDND
jgi:DNA-binding beta-propeller fold protein YncE